MGQKGKFLVTSEGRYDLGTYTWDDQLFTNILVKDNPIDIDQAMGISRSLREDISNLEIQTITMSVIELGMIRSSPLNPKRSRTTISIGPKANSPRTLGANT